MHRWFNRLWSLAPLFVFSLFASVGVVIGEYRDSDLFPYVALGTAATAFVFLDLKILRNSMAVIAVVFGFAALHTEKINSIHDFFLLPNLNRGESIRVSNVIAEIVAEPKIVGTGSQNSARSVLKIYQFDLAGRTWACDSQFPAFFEVFPSKLQYGDRIELSGKFEPLLAATSQGAFDEKKFHYRANDAIGKFRVQAGDRVKILQSNQGNPLVAAAIVARKWLDDALNYGIQDRPVESRAVVTAMVLGTREDAPEEIEDLFRLSGTMHIFAVSGLHIGIIAGVCYFILPLFGVSRRVASMIMIPAILFYAFITGLRPSAIRAAIMVCVVAAAFCFRRNPRVINSLGFAALIILALNTQELFQIGFQLSFAVLLTIILFAEPIGRLFYRPFQIEPLMPRRLVPRLRIWADSAVKLFSNGLGVSLAAWIGSLFLIGWYFKIITLTGVMANLVMIPIATVIIGIAVASSILFAVKATFVTAFLNHANATLATWLVKLAFLFSTIPGGYLSAPDITLRTTPPDFAQDFSLQILANDGSSANLLSIPGLDSSSSSAASERHWLIDTGDPFLFRGKVQPLLRSHGINQLEGVFLSHGDQDHIGAMPIVIDRFQPRATFESHLSNRARVYKTIRTAADLLEIPNYQLVRGGRLQLDTDTTLEVLYPPRSYPDQPRADDHCLVVRLHHHHWRILFTFDAGFTVEKWLLENGSDLKSDLWIKGRHANTPSGLIEFLNAVDPQAVVATNAGFPVFERIPAEWIDELAKRRINFFDLEQAGSVSVAGGSQRLSIESFLQPDHVAVLEAK